MSNLDELEQKAEALHAEVTGAPGAGVAPGAPIEPGAEAAPGGEPGQVRNNPEVVKGVMVLAVTMLAPMFPSLKTVYTPEVIDQVAAVSVPLADKYGIDLSALDKYPEVAFAVTMLPLGFATYKAVLHDLTQGKQQTPPPPPPGQQQPQPEPQRQEEQKEMLPPVQLVRS